MGFSLFRRKEPQAAEAPAAETKPAVPAPAPDGVERLTANDWAKKHSLNEVAAERAAMRAGRWHDLFTEEEFLDLIKRSNV